MIAEFALAAIMNLGVTESAALPDQKILGQWKGIDMFQDSESYDGRTYYLPNSEEIVITENKFSVYFYPYFKSDEFDAVITPKNIQCNIGRKKVKSEYYFMGDTLVLSMNFINKNFIKMYERVEMDASVIAELNEYGFNPSSVTHEFELDTLHPELRRGFKHFDSLNFEPLKYIQFIDDQQIKLNRGKISYFSRGYQYVRYTHKDKLEEFRIYKLEGTQQFTIIPFSQCQCDSIHIPYLVVNWADRIRKKMSEE